MFPSELPPAFFFFFPGWKRRRKRDILFTARLRSPPPPRPPRPPPPPVWPNVSISSFKARLFFFLSATTAAIGSLGRDGGGLILIGRRRYNWSCSCAVTLGRDSVSRHRRRRRQWQLFVFYRIRYQICWRSDGRRCRRTMPKSLCSGRQTDISSRHAPCHFVRMCCFFCPRTPNPKQNFELVSRLSRTERKKRI